MVELKFETWQLTPESLLRTPAPMVLRFEQALQSQKVCQTQMAGPNPQRFWVSRFRVYISNMMLLLLKGPHFDNNCPKPNSKRGKCWYGKMELMEKRMKDLVIAVKLKSHGNTLGPFAPLVSKTSSWALAGWFGRSIIPYTERLRV